MSQRTGKDQGAKSMVMIMVHVVAGATLIAIATVAAASAASGAPGPGFQSGTLRIAFTNGAGSPVAAPRFDIASAYPGMAPQHARIDLRNIGTIREIYTVSSRVGAHRSHSLDDVLFVTVKDAASGAVVYRGTLSGLSFRGSTPLAAGQSRGYLIRITWPRTARNDNAYQGQVLSFALQASAKSAA